MIAKAIAMSRKRAQAFNPAALGPYSAILSIGNPFQPQAQLQPGYGAVLRCAFQFVGGASRAPDDNGPTPEQIDQILDFLERLSDAPQLYQLVVHCGEGRQRSVAVARFAGIRYGAVVTLAESDVDPAGSVSLFNDLERGRRARKASLAPH